MIMRKILLFLMLFTAFAAAQEGAVAPNDIEPKPLNRSGFYFDLSLGGVLRHFEAEHPNYPSSDYLGYTGKGIHFSTRIGGIIKGVVAIFGNTEFEYTSGKNTGWDKDRRTNTSFLAGIGSGVTYFPFYKSTRDIRNLYIGTAFNVLIGGGGKIGLLGANVEFESGFLWNISDRYYTGVAIGGDFYGSGDINYDHAQGKSIWIAFKFIRK